MILTKQQRDIIRDILNSPSDSFVELARTAALVPEEDFRGADLHGVDFGFDDLTGFNFTGANMSGTDSSNANTNNAIFDDVHTDQPDDPIPSMKIEDGAVANPPHVKITADTKPLDKAELPNFRQPLLRRKFPNTPVTKNKDPLSPSVQQLVDSFYREPSPKLSDRILLMRTLSTEHSEHARELLVNLAFPVRVMHRKESFEEYKKYDKWVENPPIEEALIVQKTRLMTANRLYLQKSFLTESAIACMYLGEVTSAGGTWISGSICLDGGNGARILPIIEIIDAVFQDNNKDILYSLFQAATGQSLMIDELRLLSIALFIAANVEQEISEGDLTLAITKLKTINPKVAPAFIIGLTNDILARHVDGLNTDVVAVRKSALHEYNQHLAACHYASARSDGYWMAPSVDADPNDAMPDKVTDCVHQLQEVVKECAVNIPTTKGIQRKAISLKDGFVSESAHLVHKLKAKDSTQRWAYYFVLVEPEDEESFLSALKSKESIDLEDYGKVIASCYGERPTDDIRKSLKEQYGFEVDEAVSSKMSVELDVGTTGCGFRWELAGPL